MITKKILAEKSSLPDHTLKSAEKTHLLPPIFAQDKTFCSKLRVQHTENGPWWLSSHTCDVCAPWG